MSVCVQNISLVALVSITTLSFAFMERKVAFFGYVSFVKLFTGTMMCAPFEKPFAFRRSIVEFGVKLDAWIGVIALCCFKTPLAVFIRLVTGAVITVSHLNTCEDSMTYIPFVIRKNKNYWVLHIGSGVVLHVNH